MLSTTLKCYACITCRHTSKTLLKFQPNAGAPTLYATQPDHARFSPSEAEDTRKLIKTVENLLKNDTKYRKEDVTFHIRHAGQLFEYNKVLRAKQPTAEQAERIYGDQIKKSVMEPSSIEDYLYMKSTPLQPFPKLTSLPGIYAGLSKSRLTSLVVLTAMGGYAMAPGPFDMTALSLLSVGTFLQSAAANATNQTIEVKYDSQMYRTRNRPLVRGLVSRQHAAMFAATSGVLGTSLLYFGVNPLTCYLGVINYLLYTSVYTPMKRVSVTNTWIGSVVGALPPLMGWTAATNSVDLGGLWIAALLYIWQFPHFKALSWNVKADYQRAGYVMSSVIEPDLCKRVAFRHTMFMTLGCLLGPAVGTTTNMFILYSLPCNLYGVYLGWRFYSDGDSSSSRKLFRFSLIQIPYLIVMMLIAKNWQQSNHTKEGITLNTTTVPL